MTLTRPRIDETALFRDLEALASIGRTPAGGVERVAYSAPDAAGRAWLHRELKLLGVPWRVDPAGNTVAVYAGRENRPALAMGSHTDTVPDGGAFDGALGVVAALNVLKGLAAAAIRLRHPLELINFAAEEATMGGGTTGSQAMAGLLEKQMLDKKAWDGRLVREHLVQAGLAPERVLEARRKPGELAAFLELHIEQGNRLESSGNQAGIVTGFVAIRRYEVVFPGSANHAGTTPMSDRDDALVKAAPLITRVRDVAVAYDIVATVGTFTVFPGAPNVIPGRVDLVIETRGLHEGVLDRAAADLQRAVGDLGGSLTPIVTKPAVKTSLAIQTAISRAGHKLGLRTLTLSSGAGHDAMVLAALCPVGMFFVPSVDGVSHSPREWTAPEDCLNGARLLLESVLLLDQDLGPVFPGRGQA